MARPCARPPARGRGWPRWRRGPGGPPRRAEGAPGLQAVTMSGDAAIVSLARSARPVAIVADIADAPLVAWLGEQAGTEAIPIVTVAAAAAPTSVVAAVRAALAAAAPLA